MSATDKLDQIDKRHGAWFRSEPDTAKWSPAAYFAGSRATDAEMSSEIVRDDVPALVAALRAVLDLHRPVPVYEYAETCPGCISGEHDDVIDDCHGEALCPASPTGEFFCDECSHEDATEEPTAHPCPTVRAIEEALS